MSDPKIHRAVPTGTQLAVAKQLRTGGYIVEFKNRKQGGIPIIYMEVKVKAGPNDDGGIIVAEIYGNSHVTVYADQHILPINELYSAIIEIDGRSVAGLEPTFFPVSQLAGF